LKEQLLPNFSESLLSSSSHLLRTSTLGSKLAFTFVCLFVCCCNCRSSKIRFVCFVFVCLAQSSDLHLFSSCFFFFFVFPRTPS
jgi:hypothetical protein